MISGAKLCLRNAWLHPPLHDGPHLRFYLYLTASRTTLQYHHFYNQPKNDFHTGIKDEADIICISSLRTFAFEAYIAKALESEFHYLSNSISRFQTSFQLKREEWLL